MSTTLIFVRHGESNANGSGFFAGQLDIDLSERGFKQAELTAKYINQNYKVDAIYSSDLKRAYCTAKPIADGCKKEIVTTSKLREIFAGDWQGICFDELQTKFPESYDIWLNDVGNAHPTNGESVKDFAFRIFDIAQEIANNEKDKTVVIVTHATPIRTLVCRLKGLGLDRMKDIPWVSNASVTIIKVDESWVLESENFDKHLEGLKTKFPANV